MEPVEYGCHEENIEEKDDDSLIDKCWEAKYKNDSRKWLIRDATYNKRKGPLMSCMKTSYMYPVRNDTESEHLGIRKSQLLQKFYDEATEEVAREHNAPPPVEEYCTEYDGNYKIPGFEVEKDPHTKFPELYEKYPLYGAMPTTIYSHILQSQYPKSCMPGVTASTDPRSPFKRSSGFTTPIYQRMDDRDC